MTDARHVRRAFVVTLSIAALVVAGVAVTVALRGDREPIATADESGAVYVPQLGGGLEVRPRYVAPSAGNVGFVVERWRTYGGDAAVADAEYTSNDCIPSCVGGTRTVSRNVLVLSSIGRCRGRRAYLSATVRESDDREFVGTSIDLGQYCRERSRN